ncbi:MAG: Rieske (2Fe-2S) protein [Beijerinckiaceae bacterium]|nr:Rieske (2Fe-2S) protein [Beijerinckiaceae bacterium]
MSGDKRAASADIPVFAICATGHIEQGHAKAFDLCRRDEDGQGRPFRIFVVHTSADGFVGYVNTCPHEGVWLNFGSGEFLSADREFLQCGRHGSRFEITTGLCISGPCENQSLEPVALIVIDGDVCLCGILLDEESGIPNPFDDWDDWDDTMEIMIHPG